MNKPMVEKDIIQIVAQKPAFIKKVVDINEDLLFKCIKRNTYCATYLEDKLKTSSLLSHLLKEQVKPFISFISSFPQEIRDTIPDELLKTHLTAIRYFPKASYDTWLEAAKCSLHESKPNCIECLEDVPEQYRTKELLAYIFGTRGSTIGRTPCGGMVESDWNKLLDEELIGLILKLDPNKMTEIPERFYTRERLKRYFYDRSVSYYPLLNIKEDLWDEELILLAIKRNPDYIYKIHPKLITEAMWASIVDYRGSNIEKVPNKYLNQDMIINSFKDINDFWYNFTIPKRLKSKAFLIKVAELDKADEENNYNLKRLSCYSLENEADRITAIKVCPKALSLVAKENQTEKIINTFFLNTDIETLDNVAKHICLNRIKKEHIPFMLGTQNKLLQNIIHKKSIKQTRAIIPETVLPKGETCYTVNLNNSEYKALKRKYILTIQEE